MSNRLFGGFEVPARAFAFDPDRRAIILVAGDKAGVAQKRFYKALIAKADARFADHLERLKGKRHARHPR